MLGRLISTEVHLFYFILTLIQVISSATAVVACSMPFMTRRGQWYHKSLFIRLLQFYKDPDPQTLTSRANPNPLSSTDLRCFQDLGLCSGVGVSVTERCCPVGRYLCLALHLLLRLSQTCETIVSDSRSMGTGAQRSIFNAVYLWAALQKGCVWRVGQRTRGHPLCST